LAVGEADGDDEEEDEAVALDDGDELGDSDAL
jgi:hypothetical protein